MEKIFTQNVFSRIIISLKIAASEATTDAHNFLSRNAIQYFFSTETRHSKVGVEVREIWENEISPEQSEDLRKRCKRESSLSSCDVFLQSFWLFDANATFAVSVLFSVARFQITAARAVFVNVRRLLVPF